MPRSTAARTIEYLLIDVSNSYTKFAFATAERILVPQKIPTAKLTTAILKRRLHGKIIELLIVCSVVPARNSAIRHAAGKTKILWVNANTKLGVKINYPKPKMIGADRLANAAAVAQLYGYPAIVVDFGTAVTFDIISQRGAYIGGVIAPGLEAMTNFLYQRTALLPRLTLREPKRAVGKSTRDAMMSGAIFGYRGLVHEILARIKAEEFARARVKVVATGGYARLIAAHVKEIPFVHPNLTLEGLRLIGNLNR